MTLSVFFRVDASTMIGIGHLMRCLTLADGLVNAGLKCAFICREHPGNMIKFIRNKGHPTYALPYIPPSAVFNQPEHSLWLGGNQEDDAKECINIMKGKNVDWLIVDHYGLDAKWETLVKEFCVKLMVIDDLADRSHECELLLDQTFGRESSDYLDLVGDGTRVLCGSKYALLRPEFLAIRSLSLQRRNQEHAKNILVFMGGIDANNVTGLVLEALEKTRLLEQLSITVVLGSSAPWLDDVRQKAANMPWNTRVEVGVENMGNLMAFSDIAIGAAGTTSWERCCLGLPTILLVLAQNQLSVAYELSKAGAADLISDVRAIDQDLPKLTSELVYSLKRRMSMSSAAAKMVDGDGLTRVIREMKQC